MHRGGGCLSDGRVRQVQRSVQDTTPMETAAQRLHLITFICAITSKGVHVVGRARPDAL